MRYVTGQDGHSDPSRAGVKDTRSRWRFDAIEDRAVFELLTEARQRYQDGPISWHRFWVKYAPARDAFVGAVGLCLKLHHDPANLVCVLHG